MQIQLREPNLVMKLSRLGSFHQSKISFLRSFLKEFKDWNYKRDLFDLDENGFGKAVYSFSKNKKTYSLVCFANNISDEERSDRVIATKWDAAFALYDGVPSKKDIERMEKNVPKQEIGRLTYKELTLSRANKSVRLFNYVVESLSSGKQPDKETLSKVEGVAFDEISITSSFKLHLLDSNSNGFAIAEIQNVKAKVSKVSGEKCQRCWKYEENLINNEICNRCNNAIS